MNNISLYQGDCLEIMKCIPNKSIDMILCDLPYGHTKNKWDSVIPFDRLWEQYNRITKENAAIAMFADGMFMADLMKSNEKIWRYNIVWDKVLVSGFLNANRMPLRRTEEIVIFYKKPPIYNQQKTVGVNKNHSKGEKALDADGDTNDYNVYHNVDNSEKLGKLKCPTSLLTFSKPHPSVMLHPTEKPVPLLEWLIKTYTNEGMIVLDNCMGSGSTGVACLNTNRKFVGIELDEKYFEIAEKRISNAEKEKTK